MTNTHDPPALQAHIRITKFAAPSRRLLWKHDGARQLFLDALAKNQGAYGFRMPVWGLSQRRADLVIEYPTNLIWKEAVREFWQDLGRSMRKGLGWRGRVFQRGFVQKVVPVHALEAVKHEILDLVELDAMPIVANRPRSSSRYLDMF